ncbi:MAG: hypothetical protein K1X94_05330 [Sandaracinaceae bacterium]|nr:hypothetical protein [Sandaracinaceae bacterium]
MPTRYDQEFRRIARSLSSLELMRASDDTVAEDSAELVLDKDAGRRFLDFYGDQGLRLALDRYGIFSALARRGYADVTMVTRAGDDRHALFVETEVEGRRERLIELVVRRDLLVPHVAPGLPSLRETYKVLTIDWLLLRHPLGRFTAERPRLPGQDAPGLGVGWRVMSMLARVVWRLELDAMVTIAEYLHNAEHYAREMPCFDPVHQGRLRAVLEHLREEHGLSTAQASWALEWGLVRTRADDAVLRWRGELMVATEDESLADYLHSSAYAECAESARRGHRLWLDRVAFDARWALEGPALEGVVDKP